MRPETFRYCGETLTYLDHPYNRASLNMRSVEAPIAWHYLRGCHPSTQILEVGNVLAHYGSAPWLVLDARERGANVINADVMTWEPAERYGLIVSVSTVEHIGYGKHAHLTPRQVTPAEVIARLRGWLEVDGTLMVTVPTGYNPELDEALREGSLGQSETHAMRRISDDNEWAECTLEEALAMPFRFGSHRQGGGMVVLIWQR